jgi:nicotinate-nucleotide adenylyltransferase
MPASAPSGPEGAAVAQKLGILGGTFNPIHLGHLAAAEEVGDRLELDQVIFIPAFLPPHKNEGDAPTARERQEMVRLAIEGNPRFSLSSMEVERGGRSYTIDTIMELRRIHRDAALFFITGLDSFLDIRTWKEWQRLLTLCSFVVLSREGYGFRDLASRNLVQASDQDLAALDAGTRHRLEVRTGDFRIFLERVPLYEISSTDVRARIKQGRSVKYRLPVPVERYIIEHNLYA